MKHLIAPLLFAPTALLAHTGAHDFSSLPHFASQPDHLGMIALGLAIVALAFKKAQGAAKQRAANRRSGK